MSDENTVGREPIELVEFVLPRCANTYGVAPCTASGGAGAECFNCRATCQDVDNYRARPDGGLTAQATYEAAQDVIAGTDYTTTDSVFIALDANFPATAEEGTLFHTPPGGTLEAAIGITGGNLLLATGGQTVDGSISVDATPYLGRRLILFLEIDFTASGASTLNLWAFDPVELTIELVGTDSFTASTGWSESGTGGFGTAPSSTVAGLPAAAWPSIVLRVDFYVQTAPSNMLGQYSNNLWLGRGVFGEPRNEQRIVPCLRSLSTVGTQINLSGADDDYKPLGRRATLDFTVHDFADDDVGQDPYRTTRLYNPKEQSTFWRKWLQRQKFGKVGARVRVYDGYAGQALSAYQRRAYVLERVQWSEQQLQFYCRDELTRTEFLKTQVPTPSPGGLASDITESATSLTMSGAFEQKEYPATGGTLRINDELLTYTSKSYSSGTNLTTLSGLVRGTDGSMAANHSANDQVQLCKRYTTATVQEVIEDLLLAEAGIEAQLIDLDGLATEQALYLNAFSLTALFTEPFGADTILGWLSQEVGCYIWWDERQQQIRIKAIRAVGVNEIVKTFTHEDNIIRDSFQVSEKPRQRLNTITIYFNPIDKAGDLGESVNYANALRLVNGTTTSPETYGGQVQSRDIFSRFLTTEAVVNQTVVRLANRYEDVPVFVKFEADAKDRAVWTGDTLLVSHPAIVDDLGERVVRRWLVIEAEEIVPGHRVRYMCADITLDGLIYLITENTLTTYTAEDFALGNAFITDNNGLNPDSTNGARIS
jgi:hypothetical protein